MKKIAILITDTHFKDESTIEQIQDIFRQALEAAVSNGLKEVLHLGDIFTNRTGQRLSVLLGFMEILNDYMEEGVCLHCIAGNHDKTDLSSCESYLDTFTIHPNIKVYRGKKPVLDFLNLPEARIHFLPFFDDENYRKKIKEFLLATKKPNVLLTHIGIDGVLNNDGLGVESKTVKTGIFKGFDLVLIGHYHNAQRVSRKIHYIGSTHQQNFGEDDKKGIVVLNEDLSFERIPTKYKKYIKQVFTRVELSEIDRFVKKYKDSEHNIRFVFKVTEEESLNIDREKIQNAGIEVRVERVNDKFYDEDIEDTTISYSSKDLMNNFKEYCKMNKIDPKQIVKGSNILQNKLQYNEN